MAKKPKIKDLLKKTSLTKLPMELSRSKLGKPSKPPKTTHLKILLKVGLKAPLKRK